MNHLIVAGLLHEDPQINNQILQQYPVLKRFLKKSKKHPASNTTEATLCPFFNILEPNPATASLCYFAEFNQQSPLYWYHFDPVHLKADRDSLILFDGLHLAIQATEAEALLDLCQQHFAEEQWVLVQKTTDRYYLGLTAPPRLTTYSLNQVTGKSINYFLPQGKDKKKWRSLLNEIQMLLFNAPFNQQRMEQNKPTINGIWISGGGFLPDVKTNLTQAWQLNPCLLLKGLCQRADIPLSHQTELPINPQNTLFYYNGLEQALLDGDQQAWFSEVAKFMLWFKDFQKKAREFRLYPVDGFYYQIKPSFWWGWVKTFSK